MPELKITLNPQGVMAPALRAMQNTCELMAICLTALDSTDLENPPQIPGSFFSWTFTGDHRSAAEKKSAYTNWLLSKGFHDLAIGIRRSLEEAFLYIEVCKLRGEKVPEGGIDELFIQIRRRANQINFPDLLASVNAELHEPMQFEEEFLSLQKVRNCLEHRDGIVSHLDVNDGNQSLRLILPKLKVYTEIDGREIDLHSNMRIEKEQEIVIERGRRERIFPLQTPVIFSGAEFEEIASACWFFGSDLVGKLPKL